MQSCIALSTRCVFESIFIYALIGLGVQQDSKKAFQMYTMAASDSSTDAMFSIGVCYHSGAGVPLNRSRGVEWFKKSAELDNSKGQFALGKCYYWVCIHGKNLINYIGHWH